MGYKSLKACIDDLEKHGHLVRIRETVDPNLEMAAIHRRVYQAGGPAVLFERIKDCEFTAVSNLFGTLDRSKFLFRDTLHDIRQMIRLKGDPMQALRSPFRYIKAAFAALNALPRKTGMPSLFRETTIDKLPLIKSWPDDGGAFVTLPLVYTEDIDKPGVMHANLGMYRIQLNGNEYELNREIGLHYQLHRGIGIHQTKANAKGLPLKVSIFVGGPPAHILSGVMPLPEGVSELTFAGALGNRRFRYTVQEGFTLSTDSDFVITGEVFPGANKPEGPFGDHLGYYSLTHDFPLMKVHKVWHRKNAIWPFTVVGRPPQEDTSFGNLIHEIAGPALPKEIPGLCAAHAVDAAGVHPLLLAIGSERYTPYYPDKKPQEILTIANHILGSGQLSLAKYLFITAENDNPGLDIHDIQAYFRHVLERVDWTRDLHFQTKTTIDTLDYSGSDLNSGSKVIIAAAGDPIRSLSDSISPELTLPGGFGEAKLFDRGILVISGPGYQNEENAISVIQTLSDHLGRLAPSVLAGLPLIVVVDDAAFVSRNLNNFLWVTFTRSNPSHDIHGIKAFQEHKHWGCHGPLIIDSRIKPHHAPPLIEDPDIEKRVDALGAKGGSLHGII